MTEPKTLYKISASTGKVQLWWATVDGDTITKHYGQEGGKIATKTTKAKAKNVGKANETTPEEQALVELEALYAKQIKNSHYFYSVEEAQEAADNEFIPQKVHNYKDYSEKLPQELLSSVKLNGSRACIYHGDFYSKAGLKEQIKVAHIENAVNILRENNLANFDAEVYAHGLSLQRIRAAWLKPVRTAKEIAKMQKDRAKFLGKDYDPSVDYLGYNPNDDAEKLTLNIFDIPTKEEIPYETRLIAMEFLFKKVNELGLSNVIKFIFPIKTYNKEQRKQLRDTVVAKGYEGLVHYDPKGYYVAGQRSYSVQKDKPRYDSEALVLSVEEDNLGEGVLKAITNKELGCVEFKMKIKGTHEERSYQNQLKLIGEWVNFAYEELSDKGVPTKPVCHGVRKCDSNGEPLE